MNFTLHLAKIIKLSLALWPTLLIMPHISTFTVSGQLPSQGSWQVVGTTLQEFEYDGLSRVTRSFDNNDPEDSSNDATVIYAYDSLGRQLEEVQNGQAVSSRWMGDNNRIGLVYPNGRELEIAFDELDRIKTIKDKGMPKNIVDYDYIGPGRVLERTYANGVRLTFLDDQRQRVVGYDGLRRMVLLRHLRGDNSLVAGFQYTYDRQSNRTSEHRLHSHLGDDYNYDSAYRLTEFRRDVAENGQPAEDMSYQLDGVGNWVRFSNLTNSINNMNEYTAFGGQVRKYDVNGNLSTNGNVTYAQDFGNRLRRASLQDPTQVLGSYSYDAHGAWSDWWGGRRIQKVTADPSGTKTAVRYLYDRSREIEEVSPKLRHQYVYGNLLDEHLTLDSESSDDATHQQTFYYLEDGKQNVAALTDEQGNLVERYTYDAYGKPRFEDTDNHTLPMQMSRVDNSFLFAEKRYDLETSFYYHRARYLAPEAGRFIQRDPVGIWTDAPNTGNGYTYVGNNSLNFTDPQGLWDIADHDRITKSACEDAEIKPCVCEGIRQANRGMDITAVIAGPSTPSIQPAHCQRRTPSQSYEEALVDIQESLRSSFDKARNACEHGWCQFMLTLLGDYLHTVQDCYSPAHMDQNWNPTSYVQQTQKGGGGHKESPGDPGYKDRYSEAKSMTAAILKQFKSCLNCCRCEYMGNFEYFYSWNCGCKGLTPDDQQFFPWLWKEATRVQDPMSGELYWVFEVKIHSK
jgi:RHS repeat-associated protein